MLKWEKWHEPACTHALPNASLIIEYVTMSLQTSCSKLQTYSAFLYSRRRKKADPLIWLSLHWTIPHIFIHLQTDIHPACECSPAPEQSLHFLTFCHALQNYYNGNQLLSKQNNVNMIISWISLLAKLSFQFYVFINLVFDNTASSMSLRLAIHFSRLGLCTYSNSM